MTTPPPGDTPIMAELLAERAAAEPDDTHEHVEGLSLAGEVVITRYPDGLIGLTVDGVDFPWMIAKAPPLQAVPPSEEHPFPILMVPLLCTSIEVRDVPADGDVLEGPVVSHPGDDPAS